MIIDIISDLHGAQPILEGGDLLIIAGDYTRSDKWTEYLELQRWLNDQNYDEIILIGGNHDNLMQWNGTTGDVVDDLLYEHTYLEDSGTTFRGLKIWGSPWTKTFAGMNPHCMAFTFPRDEDMKKYWDQIPDDTDILITHSPPYGVLDDCVGETHYYHVGSPSLLRRVQQVRPKLHVFGHIHEAAGEFEAEGIKFINASIMDVNYKPINKPHRVIL